MRPLPDTDFAHLPHVLTVRREANDIELPGFEAEYEKREVSVLWKPMLSQFYGEHEEIERVRKAEFETSGRRAMAEQLAARINSGEVGMQEGYILHLVLFCLGCYLVYITSCFQAGFTAPQL